MVEALGCGMELLGLFEVGGSKSLSRFKYEKSRQTRTRGTRRQHQPNSDRPQYSSSTHHRHHLVEHKKQHQRKKARERERVSAHPRFQIITTLLDHTRAKIKRWVEERFAPCRKKTPPIHTTCLSHTTHLMLSHTKKKQKHQSKTGVAPKSTTWPRQTDTDDTTSEHLVATVKRKPLNIPLLDALNHTNSRLAFTAALPANKSLRFRACSGDDWRSPAVLLPSPRLAHAGHNRVDIQKQTRSAAPLLSCRCVSYQQRPSPQIMTRTASSYLRDRPIAFRFERVFSASLFFGFWFPAHTHPFASASHPITSALSHFQPIVSS